MGLFKKFEEAKQNLKMATTALQALNKVGKIVKSDEEVREDLKAFLAEADDQLKVAANNTGDASIREAFNNIAGLLPVANQFARDGSLSLPSILDIISNRGKYERGGDLLGKAYEAGNPTVTELVDSITRSKHLLKLAAKTNGVLFRAEDGPNGEGIVNILLPIEGILPGKLSLCATDYAEFKVFMVEANKPQPPKGPSL